MSKITLSTGREIKASSREEFLALLCASYGTGMEILEMSMEFRIQTRKSPICQGIAQAALETRNFSAFKGL